MLGISLLHYLHSRHQPRGPICRSNSCWKNWPTLSSSFCFTHPRAKRDQRARPTKDGVVTAEMNFHFNDGSSFREITKFQSEGQLSADTPVWRIQIASPDA